MEDVGTYRVTDDDLAAMVKLLEAFGARNKLATPLPHARIGMSLTKVKLAAFAVTSTTL